MTFSQLLCLSAVFSYINQIIVDKFTMYIVAIITPNISDHHWHIGGQVYHWSKYNYQVVKLYYSEVLHHVVSFLFAEHCFITRGQQVSMNAKCYNTM